MNTLKEENRELSEIAADVNALAEKYGFKAVITENEFTLQATDVDGDQVDWIRYVPAFDRVTLFGNTDHLNIWLSDTRPDMTPEKAISFVQEARLAFNYAFALRDMIDPEDWQEIADVPDASEDERYTEWIQTDDFQYLRNLGGGYYQLIEANGIDDGYLISEDMVVDLHRGGRWIDEDGNYTKDAENIIASYYKDADGFKASVADPDIRLQYLAEMVYESTSGLYYDYDKLDKETTDKALKYFIRNLKYLEVAA